MNSSMIRLDSEPSIMFCPHEIKMLFCRLMMRINWSGKVNIVLLVYFEFEEYHIIIIISITKRKSVVPFESGPFFNVTTVKPAFRGIAGMRTRLFAHLPYLNSPHHHHHYHHHHHHHLHYHHHHHHHHQYVHTPICPSPRSKRHHRSTTIYNAEGGFCMEDVLVLGQKW